MPRVFIIAAHGSMPMIDDDVVELPDFTKKPASADVFASAAASAASNKKTAKKSTPSAVKTPVFKTPVFKTPVFKTPVLKTPVFKTPVLKTPVLKPPNKNPVLKTPVLKKNNKKAASTAPPLSVAFATMGMKKPVSFAAPVDTFTTAKCGQPFCADIRCDEPFVGLAYTLSQYRLQPDVPKNAVRQLIKNAMVGIRSDPRHAEALIMGENKIRCHKQGHKLTDLYLFGSNHALPVIESVTMVDMRTGEIDDVHSMFGLVMKKSVSSTRQPVDHGAADRMTFLQAAKTIAELQLDTLKGAHPFFIETKKEHIKAIDDTIKGMRNESKFEYVPELKKEHGARVKLSDLLKIGISNGVIDPENDFVVVYACRVPDERVLFPVWSPRGSDSEGSVGGTRSNKKQTHSRRHRRKTCKRRT